MAQLRYIKTMNNIYRMEKPLPLVCTGIQQCVIRQDAASKENISLQKDAATIAYLEDSEAEIIALHSTSNNQTKHSIINIISNPYLHTLKNRKGEHS